MAKSFSFILKISIVLIIGISIYSCKQKKKITVEPAFYYWKNNAYSLSDSELVILKNANCTKLYVKFFEVESDEIFGAKPIAKTDFHIWRYLAEYNLNADSFKNKPIPSWNIIPTVFVNNEVLYKLNGLALDSLADNIVFLVKKYYSEKFNNDGIDFDELQIDCDWTIKTKSNYFYLLKAIKRISRKKLSCTLRLYPYKFQNEMGIPPVDKVTLMCYNLINPLKNKDENSIQNNNELEKYLGGAKQYPIHLDIALPVFGWAQVYQNNQFTGIIHQMPYDLISKCEKMKPFWYLVKQDIELDNIYLRQGDQIKVEDVRSVDLHETIDLLKKHITFNDSTTVALFHLDENNLKKYKKHEINSFYNSFNN